MSNVLNLASSKQTGRAFQMKPYKYFDWAQPYSSLADQTGYLCPHLEAVTVIQGPKVVQVAPDGVIEKEYSTTKSGRGTTVCLTFFTEEGDRFYRVFQFHKGDVFEKQMPKEPIPDYELDPNNPWPSELWRD